MTATEMYQAFLVKLNQYANYPEKSWEVAAYLNEAQRAIFNAFFYNPDAKRSNASAPRTSFDDSSYSSELFSPFKRILEIDTSPKGFVALPSDFAHFTAVAALVDDPACTTKRYIPVKEVREMELRELDPEWGDSIDCYRWADFDYVMPYNPVYIGERSAATPTDGIRLYPNRKYRVELRYLVFPRDIAIQNPPQETVYASRPGYVLVAADVNSEFPEFVHDRIVSMAVALFAKDKGDVASYNTEMARIMQGLV